MKKKKSMKINKNVNLIIAFILGLAIAFFGFGISEVISTKNMEYLNDIINSEDKDTKKSFVSVQTIPYIFAEYEGLDEKFYIVKDADYLYIVLLSDTEYQSILATDLSEEAYTIYGYTKELPEDIKSVAISAYNELVEGDVVTSENFELFFGSIYLDITNINVATYLYFSISGILLVIASVIELRKRGVLWKIRKSKKA